MNRRMFLARLGLGALVAVPVARALAEEVAAPEVVENDVLPGDTVVTYRRAGQPDNRPRPAGHLLVRGDDGHCYWLPTVGRISADEPENDWPQEGVVPAELVRRQRLGQDFVAAWKEYGQRAYDIGMCRFPAEADRFTSDTLLFWNDRRVTLEAFVEGKAPCLAQPCSGHNVPGRHLCRFHGGSV